MEYEASSNNQSHRQYIYIYTVFKFDTSGMGWDGTLLSSSPSKPRIYSTISRHSTNTDNIYLCFYFAVCCIRCPCPCLHAWVVFHRLYILRSRVSRPRP